MTRQSTKTRPWSHMSAHSTSNSPQKLSLHYSGASFRRPPFAKPTDRRQILLMEHMQRPSGLVEHQWQCLAVAAESVHALEQRLHAVRPTQMRLTDAEGQDASEGALACAVRQMCWPALVPTSLAFKSCMCIAVAAMRRCCNQKHASCAILVHQDGAVVRM